MPYDSDRQRRFFHTETARRAGITPDMVREFDAATKGKKLPESAGEAKRAAYGVPPLPTLPKAPSLGKGIPNAKPPLASRPLSSPLARPPTAHKPITDLHNMSMSRSSDGAARSTTSKLSPPGENGGT